MNDAPGATQPAGARSGRARGPRGMTNAEIARSLGLSASTVKHYVESAMRKAGVTNRVSLAIWLREQEGAG